jgi:hypothetical protein
MALVRSAAASGQDEEDPTVRPRYWTVEYAGHEIRVTNQVELLPPRMLERLEVDGAIVDEGRLGWAGSYTSLNARVNLDGRPRHLEARLAPAHGGLTTGCHVLVDDEPVGGDLETRLDHPSAAEALSLHEQGFPGVLSKRLLLFGLPYGFFMAIALHPPTPLAALLQFAALTLGFGGTMGWLYWRSLQAQIEGYERCAARPR